MFHSQSKIKFKQNKNQTDHFIQRCLQTFGFLPYTVFNSRSNDVENVRYAHATTERGVFVCPRQFVCPIVIFYMFHNKHFMHRMKRINTNARHKYVNQALIRLSTDNGRVITVTLWIRMDRGPGITRDSQNMQLHFFSWNVRALKLAKNTFSAHRNASFKFKSYQRIFRMR